MVVTDKKNDDELLILSDDTDNVEELHFDENHDNDLDTTEWFIDFWSDEKDSNEKESKKESLDFQTVDNSNQDTNELLDFDTSAFDMSDSSNQNQEKDSDSKNKWESDSLESENSSDDLDFWGLSLWDESDNTEEQTLWTDEEAPKEEESLEENKDSLENFWTMEQILVEAIKKLESRENQIKDLVDWRQNEITELKKQISDLESKVESENIEVKKLNTEKDSIIKNRKSLEKMKDSENSEENWTKK